MNTTQIIVIIDIFLNFLIDTSMLFDMILYSYRQLKKWRKIMKKYLNITETAEYLGKKKATIYQMTHMRKIPHIKVGGNLLFDIDDLNTWLASKKISVSKY